MGSGKYLKKALKITFRIAVGFILLFILLASLLQIPAIQSGIVHRLTTAVSDKTGTIVRIDKVRIAFPKSVVVKGLFLDDLQQDTLLAATSIRVNIALRELLFRRINVNRIALEEVSIHLDRNPNDSLFNYYFLIAAFTDTTAHQARSTSPWNFSIDRVNLENIHVRYDDRYSGIDAELALQRLRLRLGGFDPGETEHNVDRLDIYGLQADLVMTEPRDRVSQQLARVNLGRLDLDNAMVNLEQETVTLEKLLLAESGFHLADMPLEQMPTGNEGLQKAVSAMLPGAKEDSTEEMGMASASKDAQLNTKVKSQSNARRLTADGARESTKEKSNWKISVDRVEFKNNELSLLTQGDREKENHLADLAGNEGDSLAEESEKNAKSFNARDIEIVFHDFSASDLNYSSNNAGVTIRSFSATDGNGFAIDKLEGIFRFDHQSFAAEGFQLETTHSAISANLQAQYPSIQMLTDSIASVSFTLDLRQLQLRNSDLLYFIPQLGTRPYFSRQEISTALSGSFSGKLADISVTDLQILTGEQTELKADIGVTGLPETDSSVVSIPSFQFTSGRQDILMLAGNLVPGEIALPDRLDLQLTLRGMLNAFNATAMLESSFGNLQLSAALSHDESFRGRFEADNFNLGLLMRDTVMFGQLSVTSKVSGNGLKWRALTARVDADVSELFLNNYVYHGLTIGGIFSDRMFEGRVDLEDENLVLGFDGLVNLSPGKEHYDFKLDLQGADLNELNFSEKDIRIGLIAVGDFTGTSGNLEGRIDLSDIHAVREEQLYALDSLSAFFANTPGSSELQVSSKLLEVDYTGTIPPTAIINELKHFIAGYISLPSEHENLPPNLPPDESEVDIYKGISDDEKSDRRMAAIVAVNTDSARNALSTAEDTVKEEGTNGEGETLSVPSNFSFNARVYNHPILSEVLLSGLTGFDPVEIKGEFNSDSGILGLDARIKNIKYSGLEINDLALVADTDSSVIHYAVSARSVATEQVEFANLMFAGNVGDQRIVTDFTSINENLRKKFAIHSVITHDGDEYRLVIDPEDLFLMYQRWEIDPDNQILFGREGVMIDRLFMENGERAVRIASVNREFNDDLSIEIKNFRLADLSSIIENDSELVKGRVDGTILVKRAGFAASSSSASERSSNGANASGTAMADSPSADPDHVPVSHSPIVSSVFNTEAEIPGQKRSPGNPATGIIADISISNLIVREVPIGSLTLTTTNPSVNRFDLSAALSGAGNDLSASGYIISSTNQGTIDLVADIASLSMNAVEAFSFGQITETAGTLSGNASISGTFSSPEVTGKLHFSEVFLRPAVLNNRLQVADETVQLRSDGLYFDTFMITDSNNQNAIINGSVKMKLFKDLVMDLQLQADDFLLMNTTVKDNETVFGRMVIDSDIDIRGPLDLPVVSGRLRLKEGSHATFIVPESRLTTDRGENVVRFEGPDELHPILEEGTRATVSRSGFTGIDLSTIFEIDRGATLRLLMDPTSTDSLVVQGEAALSLSMDRSGKMSLTGVYNITEGSYLVSLESVIKRRFVIVEGSSITWNGDPLDATLSLDARYTVQASPYDLVAAQVSGLSDADRGAYRQQVPFWVLLKLGGDMLQPDISFAIELPPDMKGAMEGALNQKLAQLNQDASSLNKQVFALLLLNRFVQENPLQAETGSTASIVRSTVGSFLSAQLNRLGAGVLPGTELNVDIQSYEEYETETPQGRTEVEVGIRQQLINERLSVQLGGSFDVEGERAMENRASEMAGDVRVEYKLTEDGALRLKGFRQGRYEGALEGQIIETGAGVSYVSDFNEWKELFRMQEKEKGQKEKNQKEKNQKEKGQKEKNQEEKNQDEKRQKEKNQEEKNQDEKGQKEKNQKVKGQNEKRSNDKENEDEIPGGVILRDEEEQEASLPNRQEYRYP